MSNGLIGTLRRECLDHVLILGEWHLRRVLKSYSLYYNETRTHLGLDKDTPLPRPAPARRHHCQCPNPLRPTPLLRSDVIFGRHNLAAGELAEFSDDDPDDVSNPNDDD
jgi:hypothetical protein